LVFQGLEWSLKGSDSDGTSFGLDWFFQTGLQGRFFRIGWWFSLDRMVVFQGPDGCSWDQDLSVVQDLDN
jgi:hypothetical protein